MSAADERAKVLKALRDDFENIGSTIESIAETRLRRS